LGFPLVYDQNRVAIGLESISIFSIVTIILFLVGVFLHVLAYQSLAPIGVCILLFVLGSLLLVVLKANGRIEQKAYILTFSVCWVWAGVAAIYSNFFNDPQQNLLDAAAFFELATATSSQLGIAEIRALSEGAGAIVVWRAIYNVFSWIGFEKGRYIGIVTNILLVSMTCVLAVKMAKRLLGIGPAQLERLVVLFASCGIFWLFASMHLRDAAVLFCVTLLIYFWVRYLDDQNTRNLMLLVAASIVESAVLALFRTEFVFVPLAMFAAGLAAVITVRSQKDRWLSKVVIVSIATFALSVFLLLYKLELFDVVSRGYEAYTLRAAEKNDVSSLGLDLIVDAPLPIRLIAGTVYLYVFPIPMWSGFQLSSVYELLKSLNALYLYFVLPLAILGAGRIVGNKLIRSPPALFLLFVWIGFSIAVAGTSLETRHVGVFMVPLLIFATVPDLADLKDRNAYIVWLLLFLVAVALIHLTWGVLKLA